MHRNHQEVLLPKLMVQKVRRALRSPGRNMIFGAVMLTIRTATSVIGICKPLETKADDTKSVAADSKPYSNGEKS